MVYTFDIWYTHLINFSYFLNKQKSIYSSFCVIGYCFNDIENLTRNIAHNYYRASHPCFGFQIAFGTNSREVISDDPNDKHVTSTLLFSQRFFSCCFYLHRNAICEARVYRADLVTSYRGGASIRYRVLFHAREGNAKKNRESRADVRRVSFPHARR